jgi:hypothetical protein
MAIVSLNPTAIRGERGRTHKASAAVGIDTTGSRDAHVRVEGVASKLIGTGTSLTVRTVSVGEALVRLAVPVDAPARRRAGAICVGRTRRAPGSRRTGRAEPCRVGYRAASGMGASDRSSSGSGYSPTACCGAGSGYSPTACCSAGPSGACGSSGSRAPSGSRTRSASCTPAASGSTVRAASGSAGSQSSCASTGRHSGAKSGTSALPGASRTCAIHGAWFELQTLGCAPAARQCRQRTADHQTKDLRSRWLAHERWPSKTPASPRGAGLQRQAPIKQAHLPAQSGAGTIWLRSADSSVVAGSRHGADGLRMLARGSPGGAAPSGGGFPVVSTANITKLRSAYVNSTYTASRIQRGHPSSRTFQISLRGTLDVARAAISTTGIHTMKIPICRAKTVRPPGRVRPHRETT